jgi:hypothetical protein
VTLAQKVHLRCSRDCCRLSFDLTAARIHQRKVFIKGPLTKPSSAPCVTLPAEFTSSKGENFLLLSGDPLAISCQSPRVSFQSASTSSKSVSLHPPVPPANKGAASCDCVRRNERAARKPERQRECRPISLTFCSINDHRQRNGILRRLAAACAASRVRPSRFSVRCLRRCTPVRAASRHRWATRDLERRCLRSLAHQAQVRAAQCHAPMRNS